MEIIYRGTNPKDKEITAKCYICETVVRFKPTEGTIHRATDQRDTDSVTVICPVCDSIIRGYL